MQIDAALVGAKLLIPTITRLSRDAAAALLLLLARFHPVSKHAAAATSHKPVYNLSSTFNVLLFTFFTRF